jgi:hypothetical protein
MKSHDEMLVSDVGQAAILEAEREEVEHRHLVEENDKVQIGNNHSD